MQMAQQHIAGLHALVTNVPFSLAVGPVARSIMETSGRVVWLLDKELWEPRGRGTRGCVARFYLDQEADLSRMKSAAYGFNHPDSSRIGELHRKTRDAIARPGIFYTSEIESDKSGNITLCKQAMPSPSEFVALAGDSMGKPAGEARSLYTYLSTMTHPNVFSYFETVDVSSGTNELRARQDSVFAAKIVSNSIGSFYDSWRAIIGWTGTGMQEALELHHKHEQQRILIDEAVGSA